MSLSGTHHEYTPRLTATHAKLLGVFTILITELGIYLAFLVSLLNSTPVTDSSSVILADLYHNAPYLFVEVMVAPLLMTVAVNMVIIGVVAAGLILFLVVN